MSQTGHEALLWLLRENAKQNLPVFAQAGIAEDRVPILRCRCGCMERAYFWTIERQDGATVHLSCPSCHGSPNRYNTSGNRISRPPLSRTARDLGLTGLVIFAIIAGGFLRDPGLVVRLPDSGEHGARQLLDRDWVELATPSGGSTLLARSSASMQPAFTTAELTSHAAQDADAVEHAGVFISGGDR